MFINSTDFESIRTCLLKDIQLETQTFDVEFKEHENIFIRFSKIDTDQISRKKK